MQTSSSPPDPADGRQMQAGAPAYQPVPLLLWVLAGLMVGIEALLAAADAGYTQIVTRIDAYIAFAFHDQVFSFAVETGEVPAQLPVSLISHAFLHAGWFHVAMNSVAFLAFGNMIARASGILTVLLIFVASAIGGALAYGLLGNFEGPMVGASGAVFGLLGAMISWQAQMLSMTRQSLIPVWRQIAGLVVINLLLTIMLQGLLAWEAHLGGFVMGWIVARFRHPNAWYRD